MKKIIFFLLTIFSSTMFVRAQTATTDEGVEINGVIWATRNIDVSGTFAATPQDYGKLYQWNKTTAWDHSHTLPKGWDDDRYSESDTWENNVCPTGWRVPTKDEFNKLLEADYTVRIKYNDYWYDPKDDTPYGFIFGTAPDTIFLPMGGMRNSFDGFIFMPSMKGFYWSSTGQYTQAFSLNLDATNEKHSLFPLLWSSSLAEAHSVRCVKENNTVSNTLTNANSKEIKVYVYNRTIVVENAVGVTSIYDIFGRCIASGTSTKFPVPQSGIYIVKNNNIVRKVSVQ